MSMPWIVAFMILWGVVLLLGFLLLGTLRSLGLLSWRLEQFEATMPRRLGRDGLKPGKKAPDFTLRCVNPHALARSPDHATFATGEWPGQESPHPVISLHDFSGKRVLLTFMQPGCSPCQKIVPELNRLGLDVQVLVVNNGDVKATQKWSKEVGARFPVVVQDQLSLSKKYQTFATPFAFLIDADGLIVSSGVINNRQHIRYVLSAKRVRESKGHAEIVTDVAANSEPGDSASTSISKEVHHV